MTESAPGKAPFCERHGVALFLVITFAFTWVLAWLSVAITMPTYLQTALDYVVKFGPSLGAIIAAAIIGGGAAVRTLVMSLARWRVHAAWYLLAIGGPLLLWWCAVVLWGALGNPLTAHYGAIVAFGGWLAMRFFAGGGLGEELGWRGFMLPRLQPRWGAIGSSCIIGFWWGLWHAPAFFMAGTGKEGGGPIELVLFTLYCVALSVIFTWVYNGTGGSVLIVALMHASMNAGDSTMDAVFPGQKADIIWALFMLGAAIAAGIALKRRPAVPAAAV